MIKYSSIGQFRNFLKLVNHFERRKILLNGTIKAHGTNIGIRINNNNQQCQSRNKTIDIENDMYGFCKWHSNKIDFFNSIYNELSLDKNDEIIIFGEWAGKGIQKGVAISEVDKFFYIFGIKVVKDNNITYWLDDYEFISKYKDIVFADQIKNYIIELDLDNPKFIQNKLIELTNNVEKECPIGLHFGISGIGEGIVWEYIDENGKSFKFKVKGEKHSVTKVKKLASIDPEKLKSINEFVEYSITENRLNQALFESCNNDPDIKNIGLFLKWINNDIIKEESDTLKENGLVFQDVVKGITIKAKTLYMTLL